MKELDKPTLNDLLNPKLSKKLLHTMTDSEWQEYFQQLKELTTPSNSKTLTDHSIVPYVVQRNWNLTNSEGIKTTYEYHCDAIKDVLRVIRKKYKKKISTDVVYSVANVAELLKYEPEMMSRLINDDGFIYFEVWLSNK